MSYMGTKRYLAPAFKSQILDVADEGPVLDLFCGMGSVIEALGSEIPVRANDFLSFAASFARARFLSRNTIKPYSVARELTPNYLLHRELLRRTYARRLNEEGKAVASGPSALASFMDAAPHAGVSDHYRREVGRRRCTSHPLHHSLAVLYFAGGYFSTQQAIDLDAIRHAIDRSGIRGNSREWLVSAWINAAGTLSNSPGHTAQFLRPNSESAYDRIVRSWNRSAWTAFCDSLEELRPRGTGAWRRLNRVYNSDALTLLSRLEPGSVGVIYADPPYTKDQYQRFYHVYETLYRYDFPSSSGRGRTPTYDRVSTFSRASTVECAFASLFRSSARLQAPLVLSYPSDGLLSQAGRDVSQVASPWMRLRDTRTVEHHHSTLGASKGARNKNTQELIHVFEPSR